MLDCESVVIDAVVSVIDVVDGAFIVMVTVVNTGLVVALLVTLVVTGVSVVDAIVLDDDDSVVNDKLAVEATAVVKDVVCAALVDVGTFV